MTRVCFVDDDYVRDVIRWEVDLSDGTTAYQDDHRPGADPPQAWFRLGGHCRKNGLWIERMRVRFRSNVVELPPGKPGYYFVMEAVAVWPGGESYDAYKVGTRELDFVHLRRYKVPELIVLGEEFRPVDVSNPHLIARPECPDRSGKR